MTRQKITQNLYRLAVEACPSGIILFDPGDRIVMVNSEVERLFGYRREELMGRSVDVLVPERPDIWQSDGKSTPIRKSEEEVVGVRKDGTKFPVEIGINQIHIHNGLLILGVIIDASERRCNDRLKDEFVSTVSHELRAPLSSITASLGLLVGGVGGQMTETMMRLLTIAHKNSKRLVRLINDILDIEKIEAGKIAFDLKCVDVTSLIEQAIEANRGFAESFSVCVRFDGEHVPVFVRTDADRLIQVITNLLANAVKFSPRDGEATVAVERDAQSVRILVRDHGPGIPEDFRPRVFEKFAQADATDTRLKGGTGLGLSIVKEIVRLLGGSVGFETPAGGGTVFHVALPRWDFVAGAGAAHRNKEVA